MLAGDHSGFPVLGQFLTSDQGWFQHGEPPHELEVVANLLNCVLGPELVAVFMDQVEYMTNWREKMMGNPGSW